MISRIHPDLMIENRLLLIISFNSLLNIKQFQILVAMELNKNSQFEDHFLSFPHEYIPPQIDSFIEPRQMYGFQPAVSYTSNHPQEQITTVKEDTHLLVINKQLRFYQEYKKIYTVSYHLQLQRKKHMNSLDTLSKRLKSIEERMRNGRDKQMAQRDKNSQQNKAKRARRTAEEIEKRYKCEVKYCERVYGAQGSLQQHIKLKHPSLYQPRQHTNSQDPSDNQSQ